MFVCYTDYKIARIADMACTMRTRMQGLADTARPRDGVLSS